MLILEKPNHEEDKITNFLKKKKEKKDMSYF